MKKSIFYYLFAVVCTVCLFTACSDDDNDDKVTLIVDNIVGTYPGKMDIRLTGNSVASDIAASITVGKVSDGKVKVSLSNFKIPDVLPSPVNIEAECDVTPSTDELKLNGTATIDLPVVGKLDVVVTGDADGEELDLDIVVTKVGVVVDFDGHKKK